MKNNTEIENQRRKIIAGLELAYERLIIFKKSKNSPLVILKNGKVSEINACDAPLKISYKK